MTHGKDDEYIEVKDLEKHQRKEKVNRFFGGLKEGAQKIGGAVGSTIHSGAQKIKEYKEKEPERREKRIEKLRIQEKTLLEKKKEMDLKGRVNKLRDKTRPNLAAINSGLLGGGLMQMGTARPASSAPVRHQPKASSKKYTVINGKAYEIAGSPRRTAASRPRPKATPVMTDPFSFGIQHHPGKKKKQMPPINPFGF